MGRRKKGRDIDGVLLLDKPVGCSSNAALQRVRRLFNARKAGHTGSLDPLASGLLPICLGEATKVSSWLLHADKRYRVTAALDYETDTGDREGQATRYSDVAPPAYAQVQAVVRRFLGAQQQIPPMYSALKRDGRPLYELARAGVEVKREARDIHVYTADIVSYDDAGLTLDVAVSRGTYVRTLVEDMARAWGGAAHVAALRRTGVGHYNDEHMLDFEQLQERAVAGPHALDATLVSTAQALTDWPIVVLDAQAAVSVRHGRAVTLADHAQIGGWVRIMDEAHAFLGLGEVTQPGVLAPRRMFTRPLH